MLSQPTTPSSRTRYFVGLDVHRATIASCVYDADLRRSCDEREFSAQKPERLSRFVASMRSKYSDFRCCYEASFCGTALYEALTALGVDCVIIAPGSIPWRNGDRIKTDRRDARKLAEYFAAGLLTEMFYSGFGIEVRPAGLDGGGVKYRRSQKDACPWIHARDAWLACGESSHAGDGIGAGLRGSGHRAGTTAAGAHPASGAATEPQAVRGSTQRACRSALGAVEGHPAASVENRAGAEGGQGTTGQECTGSRPAGEDAPGANP